MEGSGWLEVKGAGEFIGTLAALVVAYSAWCVRVELRLNRFGENTQRLKIDVSEVEKRVDRLGEQAQKHGEMLAGIMATLVSMNSTLQHLVTRLDRGKE